METFWRIFGVIVLAAWAIWLPVLVWLRFFSRKRHARLKAWQAGNRLKAWNAVDSVATSVARKLTKPEPGPAQREEVPDA